MKFKGKVLKVKLVGDAKEEFQRLNQLVGEEKSKGIETSEYQTLFRSIKQKVIFLNENPEYGKHIGRNKIPKFYFVNYDVNNLWKVNLAGAWRMIYTIKGTEIEIISVVLDIINHKSYDKKFKYKKR